MAHQLVQGEGLRTLYEGNPSVVVRGVPDGPVALELRFVAQEAPGDNPAVHTRLTFESVFEYRWIAFNQSYPTYNDQDYEFALIEIVESEWIEAMLSGGMRRAEPPGQRFSSEIGEDALHHYRIGFDDYGTFDVICLGLRIDREGLEQASHRPPPTA